MPPRRKSSANKSKVPIKEVSVGMGVTINLGNYQSARMDIGLAAPISDGASATRVHKQLVKEMSQMIVDQSAGLESTVKTLIGG